MFTLPTNTVVNIHAVHYYYAVVQTVFLCSNMFILPTNTVVNIHRACKNATQYGQYQAPRDKYCFFV